MSRAESQTAILVAAEALLRACDYPATRGLPAVSVSTTLLGQLAGAVASVVDMPRAEPERVAAVPLSSNRAQQTPNAENGAQAEVTSTELSTLDYCGPCPTCADLRAQLAALRGDRPGLCSEPECFRVADLPSGTCHHHSPHAETPHPWQRAGLRSGVFAVEQGDG